jgi:serine/threonine-protein kinase
MAHTSKSKPPLAPGTVVNDRYDIQESLGRAAWAVFLAYDWNTRRSVALKSLGRSRMPATTRRCPELLLARSVSRPNVCHPRLAPSPWGPVLVMERIAGQTLPHIRRKKAQGGTSDGFRKISGNIRGPTAIHAQGLVLGSQAGQRDGHERSRRHPDFGFAQGAPFSEAPRGSGRRNANCVTGTAPFRWVQSRTTCTR